MVVRGRASDDEDQGPAARSPVERSETDVMAARRRTITLIAALCISAGACRTGDDDGGGGGDVSAVFLAVDPSSTDPTDLAIAAAQARLEADPEDDGARVELANAFLQRVRENGDPTLYARIEVLLDEAAEGRADDHRILIAQGTLALAVHDFERAVEVGQRAVTASPGTPAAYGVLVDAYNELGRYDEALAATQAMADLRPDLSALARVSYARELRGDIPGAVTAMTQAATAGGAAGESAAFVRTLLGNLLLLERDPTQAAASYDAALVAFPGYAAAQAGQARLLVAQGRPGEAADLLAHVVERQPLPEFAIAHGDALTAAGRLDEAAEAYDLVDALIELQRANGVDVDLELALYRADHDAGDDAVDLARRALEERPSVFAHDALAWNLFRVGELEEAAAQSAQALALGSVDPQLRFHAAAIAAATGDTQTATTHLQSVLDTNPRFSAALIGEVEQLATELDLEMPPPLP
jgi:tetratricopeptide (TPR) repeat protein